MMEVEWEPFGLDAFATEWNNNQLPRYYSKYHHDGGTLGLDAMMQQLSQEQEVIYAFPPPIRKLVESLLQLVDSVPLEVVLVVLHLIVDQQEEVVQVVIENHLEQLLVVIQDLH